MYIPTKQDETMAQLQQARGNLLRMHLNKDGTAFYEPENIRRMHDTTRRGYIKGCCTYGALWYNSPDLCHNTANSLAQVMLEIAFETLHPETNITGYFSISRAFGINDSADFTTLDAIAIYDKAMELWDNA